MPFARDDHVAEKAPTAVDVARALGIKSGPIMFPLFVVRQEYHEEVRAMPLGASTHLVEEQLRDGLRLLDSISTPDPRVEQLRRHDGS